MSVSLLAARQRISIRCAFRAAAPLAVGLCLLAAPISVNAAGTELTDGAVSPGQGTTATSFVLQVDYASSPLRDAVSVRAEVVGAGMTIDMALIDGNAANGRWRAAATLPAGTWAVVFRADATVGFDPTLALADAVVVTPATQPPTPATQPPTPAPTPRPTPPPTPRPTPRPTPSTTPRPTQSAAPPSASPSQPPSAPPGSTSAAPTGVPSRVTVQPLGSAAVASTSPPAGATPTGSAVIVAGRSSTEPATSAPRPEEAPPGSEEPGVAPTNGSTTTNALLLLGASLSVLGGAMLARQWLMRRRPPPGPQG